MTFTSGQRNLITDVPGISVGNATSEKSVTGVTVLRNAKSYICACDVRGGAPASRETHVLNPENLVGRADALVLAGGSVFGLGAADGVAAMLSSQNVGLRLSQTSPAIPIVPAAALHDLGNDGDKNWGDAPPYRKLGVKALNDASANFRIGSVGAARGAKAGERPGGLGSASILLPGGVTVGALVAVNSIGSAYFPDGKTFHAWSLEIGEEFGGHPPPTERDVPAPFPPYSRLSKGNSRGKAGANTTLAIVATSADLTPVEAKRVAICAHNGIARAIRPAHTIFDGDIVFSIATAETPLPGADQTERTVNAAMIGAAAADCLARAIARGVYAAEDTGR